MFETIEEIQEYLGECMFCNLCGCKLKLEEIETLTFGNYDNNSDMWCCSDCCYMTFK